MNGGPNVIQGCFLHGLMRILSPAPAQARSARPATLQQRPALAPVHRPSAAQPGMSPARQGAAVPLPAHLAFSSVGGQPLPPAVLQKMEASFGTSFADVRIHVGPHVSALGAVALTHGSHIHFASGHYNPATAQGQQLLGRELAHVVQQRAGRVGNPFGSGIAVVQSAILDAEADRLGRRAAASPMPAAAQRKPALPPATAVVAQRKAASVRPHRAGARPAPPVQPIQRKARPSGGVIQRNVSVADASTPLRDAWGIFLRAVGNANAPRTAAMINAARHGDTIDLNLRSSGMYSRVGFLSWFTTFGLTTWWDGYGGRNPQHMTDAMATNVRSREVWDQDRKPTIELIVTKHFWEGVGSLISTLAHEAVVHAARYAVIADEIRGQRISTGQYNGWFDRNLLVRANGDGHHESVRIGNVNEEYRTELRNIVNAAVDVLRGDGRESVARELIKCYFGDLWEHTPGVTATLMGLFGVTLSDDI